MSLIDAFLNDIDTAIRGTDAPPADVLLRRITAMLIHHLADLSDHQLAMFDTLLLNLARAADTDTRAELSERLADLHPAPKNTIRALAFDDALRVAKPVIERSPCLDENTLIAIINKGNRQVLSHVAIRQTLPAAVIDHVIGYADEAFLNDLAGDESKPISDQALRLLAERAVSYPPLYRILRTRPDLAPRHIGAMIEAARFRINADGLARSVDHDMMTHNFALEIAKLFAEASQINTNRTAADQPDDIHNLLECDQIDAALAILAQRAGLTTESVKRAFHAPQHEPLMFLLRAQDYPLTTMLRFMRHKHGVLSHELEAQMSDAYCALARETAKRIAMFMTEKIRSSEPSETELFRHSA